MVDGPGNHELGSRYRVEGFPEFVYLAPGKKGMKAKGYDGPRNDEDGMRSFLKRMIEKHDKLKDQLGTQDSSLKDKIKGSSNSTEPEPKNANKDFETESDENTQAEDEP